MAHALGGPPEPLALRDLRTKFSRRAERLAPAWEDLNYYAASENPGLARLCSQMQESAFWSQRLYGIAWQVCLGLGAVLLVLVIVALLVVVGAGSSNASLQVARVGVVFLSFLVFSDLLTQGIAWWNASRESDEVYRRLETGLDEIATALAVFGDYSVATATTPPIPTLLYRLESPRLARAWREALD